ncbi:MAG: hypothetical protein LQ342_006894 [Letrouitia transgressa]|nr:MAG: hypothetical protein LQ342_006894 [Letrouitia transgressa]
MEQGHNGLPRSLLWRRKVPPPHRKTSKKLGGYREDFISSIKYTSFFLIISPSASLNLNINVKGHYAVVFAIAGTCGLILLSIFDTVHYPRLHDGLLLLFIAGYMLSAIFICAEYQRLGVHFRQHRVLRASFWMKLFFILSEFALAVIFVSTSFTHNQNEAAVFGQS